MSRRTNKVRGVSICIGICTDKHRNRIKKADVLNDNENELIITAAAVRLMS